MKLSGKSLVTRVLILFVVFNLLSVFLLMAFVIQQDRQKTKATMEESIREITYEKARVISTTMRQVAYDVENIAAWMAESVENTETRDTLLPGYERDREGVLRRILQPGQRPDASSTIFFPANIETNAENVRIINATEDLDPIFALAQERSGMIRWTYVSTEQGLLRLFPFIDLDMYEKDHQQKGDPFYQIADEKNNPSRETVWTIPYADFLGTGWMVSCSHPVYFGDQFLGVASSDVSLLTLQKEFLTDFRIANSGIAYLLGDSGEIIYHPDYVPEDRRGQTDYVQGQMLLVNILDDPALTTQERKAIETMLAEKSGIVRFQESGGIKLLAFAPIDKMNWILGVEINENDYMAINGVKPFNAMIFIVILGLTLIVFSLILFRLYSQPMARLVKQAEMIADGDFSAVALASKVEEINTLAGAFNTMNRRVAEYTENLIRKNREVESIISSISGMLMILTPAYEIRVLNKRGMELFAQKGIDPIGEKCYKALFGAEAPCEHCRLHDSVRQGKPLNSQVAVGDQVFYNDYFPIENGKTPPDEIVVHSQNATNRVMMEKELLQTEKLAGIGQVSSAISHELKNPLAVIKGAICLLQIYMDNPEENSREDIDDAIGTISTAVKSAERTVYNLLDFSGKARDEITDADIGQIVEQILLLFTKDRVVRDLSILVSFNPNPLIYRGYVEPLKHILQNVITNGLFALENGGSLKISGILLPESQQIKLVIKDDGPGIPEEDLDLIFKPFFSKNPEGRGTGLGLWVTKLLLEKMYGSISVKSRLGQGAEFTILLPQSYEGQQEQT